MSLVNIPSREDINRLQDQLMAGPQVELKTEHYFSGGMYCRKVFRPAGTIIVGKIHKSDHLFMCTSGEIIVWSEKGMVTLKAGDVIESKAGTKRATLAVMDSIGVTVHKTDKTDLDEIESELIEPEKVSMYDSSNNIKIDLTPVLTIKEV
jgi:mannose-6-phosphate isomerase-like protein (cupin superfamily)